MTVRPHRLSTFPSNRLQGKVTPTAVLLCGHDIPRATTHMYTSTAKLSEPHCSIHVSWVHLSQKTEGTPATPLHAHPLHQAIGWHSYGWQQPQYCLDNHPPPMLFRGPSGGVPPSTIHISPGVAHPLHKASAEMNLPQQQCGLDHQPSPPLQISHTRHHTHRTL